MLYPLWCLNLLHFFLNYWASVFVLLLVGISRIFQCCLACALQYLPSEVELMCCLFLYFLHNGNNAEMTPPKHVFHSARRSATHYLQQFSAQITITSFRHNLCFLTEKLKTSLKNMSSNATITSIHFLFENRLLNHPCKDEFLFVRFVQCSYPPREVIFLSGSAQDAQNTTEGRPIGCKR